LCTIAGCETHRRPTVGQCVPDHSFAPDSTSVRRGRHLCTTAGWHTAQATCGQNHVVKTCTVNECNLGCSPGTGQCTPKRRHGLRRHRRQRGTIAGCELTADPTVGQCVRPIPSRPTAVLSRRGRHLVHDGGCNGAGTCDQNHVVKTARSTSATSDAAPAPPVHAETAEHGLRRHRRQRVHHRRLRAHRRSDGRQCVQTHSFAPDSTSVPDADGKPLHDGGCTAQAPAIRTTFVKTCTVNECNLGCSPGTGQCPPKQPSTACGDTDGNVCTMAAASSAPIHRRRLRPDPRLSADSSPCRIRLRADMCTPGCEAGVASRHTSASRRSVLPRDRRRDRGRVRARVIPAGSQHSWLVRPDTCASPALEATHGGQVALPSDRDAFTADPLASQGMDSRAAHRAAAGRQLPCTQLRQLDVRTVSPVREPRRNGCVGGSVQSGRPHLRARAATPHRQTRSASPARQLRAHQTASVPSGASSSASTSKTAVSRAGPNGTPPPDRYRSDLVRGPGFQRRPGSAPGVACAMGHRRSARGAQRSDALTSTMAGLIRATSQITATQ